MPFDKASDVPDNIQMKYKPLFMETFNATYAVAIADKQSPAQAEESAYKQAHTVLIKAKQKDERDVSEDGPGFVPTRDGGQAADPEQSLRYVRALQLGEEWRYSEDQPRDADGKFGAGGGEKADPEKLINSVFANLGGTLTGTVKNTVTGKEQPFRFKAAIDKEGNHYVNIYKGGSTTPYHSLTKDAFVSWAKENVNDLKHRSGDSATEQRYSEDQPRDKGGKFGAGSMSSPHEHEAVKAAGAAGSIKNGDKVLSKEEHDRQYEASYTKTMNELNAKKDSGVSSDPNAAGRASSVDVYHKIFEPKASELTADNARKEGALAAWSAHRTSIMKYA